MTDLTKQKEFLDTLTNPRQVEIKRKISKLMQIYSDLQLDQPFQLGMREDADLEQYTICITTKNQQLLITTEGLFRHYFPAGKYPVGLYAPPHAYDTDTWTHYYMITKHDN